MTNVLTEAARLQAAISALGDNSQKIGLLQTGFSDGFKKGKDQYPQLQLAFTGPIPLFIIANRSLQNGLKKESPFHIGEGIGYFIAGIGFIIVNPQIASTSKDRERILAAVSPIADGINQFPKFVAEIKKTITNLKKVKNLTTEQNLLLDFIAIKFH